MLRLQNRMSGNPLREAGVYTFVELYLRKGSMIRVAWISALLVCVMSGQQLFRHASVSYEPGGEIRVVFSDFHAMSEVVAGAPYSADTILEQKQNLPDGKIIRQTRTLLHYWRDSRGRVRVERALLPQKEMSITLVQIFDPVLGCGYILDDQHKVAHRVMIGLTIGDSGTDGDSAGAADRTPVAVLESRERLGTQTIEGVVAEGTRLTTTWPAGSQDNDRPFTNITETWYSPELKASVLSKTISIRDGESIVRLAKLTRAEANPALFQPPPDYTIVDDKDSVTLILQQH